MREQRKVLRCGRLFVSFCWWRRMDRFEVEVEGRKRKREFMEVWYSEVGGRFKRKSPVFCRTKIGKRRERKLLPFPSCRIWISVLSKKHFFFFPSKTCAGTCPLSGPNFERNEKHYTFQLLAACPKWFFKWSPFTNLKENRWAFSVCLFLFLLLIILDM